MAHDFPEPPGLSHYPVEALPTRPRRAWLPWVMLLLTVLTTLYCGFFLHPAVADQISFDDLGLSLLWSNPLLLLYGVPFSATLLSILLAHEMGHYLTCRYYRIDASPPYVIPAPPFLIIPPPLAWSLGSLFGAPIGFLESIKVLLNPFGTFGALIRIRSPFLNRRQLFDVGIGGPLAGFVLIVPALLLGLWLSEQPTNIPDGGIYFGEPLLFQLVSWTLYGSDPVIIDLHPIGFAAWFGMLATSLNLLPMGQLDGGHIVYALFGAEAHRWISRATFASLILISFISWPPFIGYILFGILGMTLGRRHPPTLRDWEKPGLGRLLLGLLGFLILILTFMPVPIKIIEEGVKI